MAESQKECSRFGQMFVNFWWLRIANHMKIRKERELYREKYVLVKIFANRLNCLKKVEIVFKMKTSHNDDRI